MRPQVKSCLFCLIVTALFLTACGNSTPSTIAPSETPVSVTNTPVPPTHTPTPLPPTATPSPAVQVNLQLELPDGDAKFGLSTALRYRCQGCHAGKDPAFGPRFESSAGLPRILGRGETRIADPGYQGTATTNQEYLIESILLPDVYRVAGEWEEPMPSTFHARITEEELADIIAWMGTFE